MNIEMASPSDKHPPTGITYSLALSNIYKQLSWLQNWLLQFTKLKDKSETIKIKYVDCLSQMLVPSFSAYKLFT